MSFWRNCVRDWSSHVDCWIVLLYCEAGLQDVHEECLFSAKDVWSLISVHNFYSYAIIPFQCRKHLNWPRGLMLVASKFFRMTLEDWSCTCVNKLLNVLLLRAFTSAPVSIFRITLELTELISLPMSNWIRRSFLEGAESMWTSLYSLPSSSQYSHGACAGALGAGGAGVRVGPALAMCTYFSGKLPAFLQHFS